MNAQLPPADTPWATTDHLPEKPTDGEFGYWNREDQPVVTTPDGLVEQIQSQPDTWYVWTPELPHGVPPSAIPFLHPVLRQRDIRRARYYLGWTVLVVVLWFASFLLPLSVSMRWGITFAATGWLIFGALESIYLLMHTRKAQGPADPSSLYYLEYWMEEQPTPAIRALSVFLALIFAVQWAVGLPASLDGHALSSPAVEQGEWGRMFSATLMHAHLPHLLINLAAIHFLGRRIEAIQGSVHFMGVWVLSALAGSLFTLMWGNPASLSVGASGGVCGCLGYLIVLQFRHRKSIPFRFSWPLFQGAIMLLIVGWVLPGIDNSGHAGGAFGGILAGLILAGLPIVPSRKTVTALAAMTLLVSLPLAGETLLRMLR